MLHLVEELLPKRQRQEDTLSFPLCLCCSRQSCSTAYWQLKNFNSKTNGSGPGVACDTLILDVDTGWMVARAESRSLGAPTADMRRVCSETSLPTIRDGATYVRRQEEVEGNAGNCKIKQLLGLTISSAWIAKMCQIFTYKGMNYTWQGWPARDWLPDGRRQAGAELQILSHLKR